MSAFFFVIFTGIVWMGLRGDIGVYTFVIGMLLGFGLWRLFRFKSRRPFSIVRAMRIVFAPRIKVSPYWLRYHTELETPAMRAVLGSMIVMTPGTVAYKETEAEEGGWTIAVHALHAKDEAEAQKTLDRIHEQFESRLRQMETL